MSPTASKILGTVNAPYRANVSVHQLVTGISSIEAADKMIGPVFSFFSEVAPDLQKAFIAEMKVSDINVQRVVKHLQTLCPFQLSLAA